MHSCLLPENQAYFLKRQLKSKEEVMALANQVVWSKLTETQRARILALLVQMLLQQIGPRQEEDKPS